MEKTSIKPSKLLYGVSALILICGIILFIITLINGISSSIKQIDKRVIVPGTSIIELNETGKYNIYWEYHSVIDGKLFETNSINGLVCSLQNVETGEYIQLNNASVNSNYSFSGRSGKSIFSFAINNTGKYEIKGWYEGTKGDEAILAIGKGFASTLVYNILLSIGVMFITTIASITLFIYTLSKRTKNKNKVKNEVFEY